MDCVVVAVTDKHYSLLGPEAPLVKLCNPSTCYRCLERHLLANAAQHAAHASKSGCIGRGLLQGCAAAGRRVQPHIEELQHMDWAVHFTCADCGAQLTRQPIKCDVPYGGVGVLGGSVTGTRLHRFLLLTAQQSLPRLRGTAPMSRR